MEAEVEGEEDAEDWPVVIIDHGSGTCKAGLSTDTKPTVVFPEVVGTPRRGEGDAAFGDAAYGQGNKFRIHHPVENGIIENFELMELVWEHAMVTRLNVAPSDHAVLLTEPPYNPKPNRERMVEIMFETFQVPYLNVSIQGVLALLGQGRTTGLVLDSGEGVTYTMPIFDGFGMPYCINRVDVAGRELNTLLAKLIAQEGPSLTTSEHQRHTRIMKEKHCYVALDPCSEFADTVDYTLPDGTVVTLGDQRWKCPEAIFTPSLVGLESMGAAGLVWESISRCEIDLRKTLLSNVVLSGGSTMFTGFRERLTKELRNFAPSASQGHIRIAPSKEQDMAVWSGGQVFASLRDIQGEQWMAIEDYEEYGANFIHDKIAVKYS